MKSSEKSLRKKKQPDNEMPSQTRRRLIQALALAPVAPSILAASHWSLAQTETKPGANPAPASPTAAAELKPSPEAETLAELVKQRYGKFVTGEQLEEIKLGLERGIRGRKRLQEFKLTNADEPDTVFSA